jgi:hypothetical protein
LKKIPLALPETFLFAFLAMGAPPFEVFEEDEKQFYEHGSVLLPPLLGVGDFVALRLALLGEMLDCVDGCLVVHRLRQVQRPALEGLL